MDIAALNLNIDSSKVLQAANDLDAFAAASKRAGAAAGNPAGSISKLVSAAQSMDKRLASVVGTLDKISQSMAAVARASKTAAAANSDVATEAANTAKALANADAHVQAYAEHLRTLGNSAQQADAHITAYREAQKAASAAEGAAARAANDNAKAHEGVSDAAEEAASSTKKLGDEARRAESGFGSLTAAAKRLGTAMAAALSVRAIVGAADGWSDMQSRVGAAIKDMEAAPQLMERLVDIANASYSPLAQTVDIYGRNVTVLRDLGRGAVEAADFTEALNHALITTATKGQDADVVLNALSRAISIGGLRAMEYETIMSRSPRVLEAIADQMGTNVVALRQMASEGKVTGQVIVDALINNLEQLRQEAGEMPATIGDAFVRMQTNFTALIGTLDQTYGISARVAASILWLADNLSRLVNVAIAAGVAFVSYRVALVAVSAAQGAATVSTTAWAASVALAYRSAGLLSAAQVVLGSTAVGAAAGMRVLATAMLANPALWLAGAITTLVMTLKSVADANAEAEERFKANAIAARDLGIALSEAGKEALGAAKETAGVGRDAATAEPKIWSFKNATDNLTQSLWEQAKAARAARVELLQKQLSEAQDRERAAQKMTVGGARNLMDEAGASLRQGDLLRGMGQAWEAQKIRWQQVLSGGRVQREAMRDYQDAARIAVEAQKQLKVALETPIGAADVPERISSTAKAADSIARIGKEVEASLDAAKAATLKYDTALKSLNEQFTSGAINEAQYRQQLTEITKVRNAEEKAAQAASRVRKAALTDEQKERDRQNKATIGFIASLDDEIARIGQSEQALRALEIAKARDAALTDQQRQRIDELAAARERALEAEAERQENIAFQASIDALKRQRGEIMLTGRALEEYRYITERLNEASREGITLSDAQLERIRRQAAEYASLKTEVEAQAAAWKKINDDAAKSVSDFIQRQQDQVQAARSVVGGFFSDWYSGIREGGKLFRSFTDGVISGLNRIIDKLLDRTLNNFLDNMISSAGGGGFLGALLGGGAPRPNALGGVYGSTGPIERFSKGGAFTNSIVSTPTLFRFAKGGAIGEMGEAGPEAIMPLKRGPDGALGVEVHGKAKPSVRMGDIHNNFSFAGAIGLDGIAAMVRQGGEQTYEQVKRDLQTLLDQLDRDGAFAS